MGEEGTEGPPGGHGEVPRPTDPEGRVRVLVELRGGPGSTPSFAMSEASRIDVPGFSLDPDYQPVPLGGGGQPPVPAEETFLVRGTVESEEDLAALRARPEVLNAYLDTPIAPFGPSDNLPGEARS